MVKQFILGNIPQTNVEVSDLPKGLYFVKIQSSGAVEVKKVIVQ